MAIIGNKNREGFSSTSTVCVQHGVDINMKYERRHTQCFSQWKKDPFLYKSISYSYIGLRIRQIISNLPLDQAWPAHSDSFREGSSFYRDAALYD